MNPRIKCVVALTNYQLELEFTNAERGIYDCNPLLNFGVFKELRDLNYFKQASAADGTVAWPHGQDICPDTLYLDAKRLDTAATQPMPPPSTPSAALGSR